MQMTRPESDNDGLDALSIPQFCARHGISPQTFYRMKAEGIAPAMFKLGTRVLISREAAAAWRREREATSAA
jgi:predicted DNA-binding transcriptional regulator AlpA